MASAATVAAVVVIGWLGLWSQLPSPPLPMDARQESIWPFIEGVYLALFTVDSGFTGIPDRLSDLADLQAALTGEWPCEEQDAFANLACDDDSFALLSGEQ
jgi:hypothetical protein